LKNELLDAILPSRNVKGRALTLTPSVGSRTVKSHSDTPRSPATTCERWRSAHLGKVANTGEASRNALAPMWRVPHGHAGGASKTQSSAMKVIRKSSVANSTVGEE
jgi:hypothetical protein